MCLGGDVADAIVKRLETGPLMVNTYIIGDRDAGEAIVVDPGGHVPRILEALEADGLTCKYIFNTHSHWDHTGGNAELKKATGAPLVIHEDEAPLLENSSTMAQLFGAFVPDSPPADTFVKEGDVLTVGSVELRVIELPGHSPVGLGLVFDEAVVVGDSLFAGSIGRTDFPGGDYELLIRMVEEKIFALPDDTLVLPGHGPETTVGREKRFNPFFQKGRWP